MYFTRYFNLKDVAISLFLFFISFFALLIVMRSAFYFFPHTKYYRWVSQDALLKDVPEGIFKLGIKPAVKNLRLKIYDNGKLIFDRILKKMPQSIELKLKFKKNDLHFVANKFIVPSRINPESSDNRRISFNIWNINHSRASMDVKCENFDRGKGFYFLEKFDARYMGVIGAMITYMNHWDYFWYASIVEKGYQFDGDGKKQQNSAWPFLFPYLGKFVKWLTGWNTAVSLTFLSNLFLLGILFVGVKLGKLLSISREGVFLSLLLFLSNPFSFFLHFGFSESLFIFLSSLSLFLYLKKKEYTSSVFAGLSSGTRFVGVTYLLLPIYSFLISKKKGKRFLKTLFLVFLSISGLMLTMAILWIKVGDPLAFVKLQSAWKGSLDFLWGDLRDTLKNPLNVFFLPDVLGFFVFIISFTYSIFVAIWSVKFGGRDGSWSKNYTLILSLYSLLPMLPVFLRFSPNALGRYSLVAFPVYLTLPKFFSKYLLIPLLVLFFLLKYSMILRVYNGLTPW